MPVCLIPLQPIQSSDLRWLGRRHVGNHPRQHHQRPHRRVATRPVLEVGGSEPCRTKIFIPSCDGLPGSRRAHWFPAGLCRCSVFSCRCTCPVGTTTWKFSSSPPARASGCIDRWSRPVLLVPYCGSTAAGTCSAVHGRTTTWARDSPRTWVAT